MPIARIFIGAALAGYLTACSVNSEPHAASEPSTRPSTQLAVTEDDLAVWTAALNDFAAQKESDCVWIDRETDPKLRKTIVVEGPTLKANGMTEPGQVLSDIREEKWTISEDLFASLTERNGSSVSLAALEGRSPLIEVIAPNTIEDAQRAATQSSDLYNWRDRHLVKLVPTARATVEGWLPGYSADGDTAVLRFWFGPTAHGAVATYLLVRRDGKWLVEQRNFAFFM